MDKTKPPGQPQTPVPDTGDGAKGWRAVAETIRNLLSNFTWPIKTNQSITILGAGRLKIPTFDADPVSAILGEIAVIGGKFKAAIAQDTWVAPGGGFGGFVNSTASSAVLPSGWTVSKSGTDYTVTHNLGTTDYAIVPVPINFASGWGISLTKNADDFVISFYSASGFFATDFNFVVALIV